MIRSLVNRFIDEEQAAIGPLYAIGIGTFIVMSAIGFDYGRLMALDSEMQNAADQAALAAATQLDGGTDAMVRARTAATNAFASATSTFANETRFANDGAGRPITNLTFEFFDGYANDQTGALLTSDAQGASARVVQVTANARRVFYALTPLVGAITSGDVIGRAMAGLQSATCNVPPMMFCVPNNASGNPRLDFPTAADIGKGLKLRFKTQGNANGTGNNTSDTAVWAPGNFGFLDIDYGLSGNVKVRTLGLNSQFSGCSPEVINSEPGFRDPQGDALNSRFDIYSGSVNANQCNNAGDFCPAENVRRDWVNEQSRNNVRQDEIAGLTCNSSPTNNGWTRVANLPTAPGTGDILQNPGSLELPFDNCLISGSCGDVFGDGVWDANAYMAKHHPTVNLSTIAPNGTRYEVYKWEVANKASALPSPRRVGYYADYRSGNGANSRYNVTLYCAYPQPVNANRTVVASNTQKDRRILTVAAVDCTGLNGSAPVKILRWVDVFLVKPAEITASDKNFFTEIIGPAQQADGSSGFQYFGRKKAVLIR